MTLTLPARTETRGNKTTTKKNELKDSKCSIELGEFITVGFSLQATS